MLEVLNNQYKQDHKKGGNPLKLSILDKLVIMLCYYREYSTMQHIAFDYNVSKSTICESIKWVEQSFIKSSVFNLPSKRQLYSDTCIEVVSIDATEVEIERLKKQK